MKLSNSDIISLAACHFCCAPIGQPCIWHRAGDPDGKKRVAKESHIARQQLAEKKTHEWLDVQA